MASTIESIPQRLNALGAPSSTLAALIGISSGTLSSNLNGATAMPGNRALKIGEVLSDLEEFARLTAPLPIDFSSVAILRECLTDLKEGRLRIAVVQLEAPEKLKAFSLRLKNGVFFLAQTKNCFDRFEILTTPNFLQSAVMVESVAGQLAEELRLSGYQATAIENKFRSEPATSLDEVWRTPPTEQQ